MVVIIVKSLDKCQNDDTLFFNDSNYINNI